MPENEKPHFWIPDDNVRNVEFTPQGRGSSFKRDDYSGHGQKLIQQIRKVSEIVVSKADDNLTTDYIVQLKSPESRPIKNEKVKLSNLGFDIISYSPTSPTSATAIIAKSRFQELFGKVEAYTNEESHPGKSNISVLEEIGDVPVEEKVDETLLRSAEVDVDCIIALYNILSLNEKDRILDKIAGTLRERGVETVEKKTFLSGVSILSTRIKPSLMREFGESYITVKSITKNSQILIRKSIPTVPLPNPLHVKEPSTNSIVAVVDSGIATKSPAFENLVIDRIPFLPPGSDSLIPEHGTLVASRILYGDSLESPTHWLEPYCKIIDVPIFGYSSALGLELGPKEDQVIAILDTIVPHLSGTVKIFNLSFGSDFPIRPNFFSLLASEIDYLAKRFDVLFIVAAGNITTRTLDFPSHFEEDSSLLQPPAESLLAITVGSVARYGDKTCLSRPNEISPFSCRGPGADTGVKPELVAHGGNLLSTWDASPRFGAYGIFSDGKTLAYDVGTSFSAPIVSSHAARLFGSYADANPNLVKSLLCHFSTPILAPNTNIEEKYLYGCGEPNIQDALYNPSDSATFIRKGKIRKDTYQYIKFHVPGCLASSNDNSRFSLKVTLVYNPPVNPDNHLEYSKARMSISVFKNTSAGLREIGTGGAKRSYILAWNPLIHFEKEFSRSYASGEWEIRLRLMTRGRLPADYLQDYAIVIQVKDLNKNENVYEEIRSSFSHIYVPVELRKAA